MEETKLVPGDRVSFEIEGAKQKPYGFGQVTMCTPGRTVIKPDVAIPPSFKMVNIKKVG